MIFLILSNVVNTRRYPFTIALFHVNLLEILAGWSME
jgi:hypothetical protein